MTDRSPRIPECADWMIDGKLVALPVPSLEEMRELKAAGFGLVVNLTEKPGPTAMAAAAGLKGAHLPIPNMAAPDLEQIQEFVRVVDRYLSAGTPVAVHCLGGLGRTGTLIACYLVFVGGQPGEAITEVRRRRPGSIETDVQERAVHRYYRHLHEKAT